MVKYMVVDLETSVSSGPHGPDAKDPSNDFYTLIYSDPDENVIVEHKPEGFGREPSDRFFQYLHNCDVLIGHNMAFDLSYFWHHQQFQNWLLAGGEIFDTQTAQYLLSGQRHSFPSLAELQLIYLNQRVKKDRISKLYKKKIGADKILAAKDRCPRLFALYHQYSIDDGETTLKIYKKQLTEANNLAMMNIIKMYNAYNLTLIHCMQTGIKVDIAKCEKTLRDFKVKEMELLQQANELIAPYWTDERLPEFNVNSPQHKSAILFGGTIKCKVRREDGFYKNGKQKFKNFEEEVEVKGFALDKKLTTESKIKGRYATGDDIINKIYKNSDNEVAKEYCGIQKEAMQYKKMCSTYLEAFINLSLNERLYPNFNTTSTITSRLSSSNPNLQNVPSKGDWAKHIQGLFVAPAGWQCVQIDFSQLEIYVLAWLSGDERMTKDLHDGVDFHCLRMSWCSSLSEGKTYQEIYDLSKTQNNPKWVKKRSQAKTISYMKAYGGGPASLAEATGLEVEDVKELLNKEDSVYYKVKGYNDHVYSTLENTSDISHKNYLPTRMQRGGVNGKRFDAEGYELLPIQSGDSTTFEKGLRRKIGYYQSPTRKRYSFEQFGAIDRRGGLRIGYSPTQTKNYQIQGTASDVQATTSAALLQILLKHQDKIQFVNEIHDSKWFYVKEEYTDKIVPQLCNIMESVPDLFKKYLGIDVPFRFPVEAEIGHNFAELTTFRGVSYE